MQPEAVFELVTYAVDHVAICTGPITGPPYRASRARTASSRMEAP